MDKEKFNDIIDFAVEREKEAVQFYQELQEMAKFQSQKSVLKEFENMERGHIEILGNIRQAVINKPDAPLPRVEDLAISDYLVESKPTADMTYQDILIIAMKREEKAHNLYTNLASESGDEAVKKLFLRLAGEEAKHKFLFEKIYDEEILTEN